MDIRRIEEMENRLNGLAAAVKDLDARVGRMERQVGPMRALFGYYGSEAWYEDREGELPEGVAAGVLSEDLVYDQITAVRELAIRMLELSTELLRE